MKDFKLSGPEICLAVRGLPETIAEKIIRGNGYEIGITARDNKGSLIGHADNNRINLIIMAGVVIEATIWHGFPIAEVSPTWT